MPASTIVSLAFDLTDDRDRQEYIHIMMRRQGLTIQGIADANDVVRTLVSTEIAGKKKSARIRSEIAHMLGVDADVLWADSKRGSPDM